MKKILSISIISASLLIAGTPIHDKMDSRLKGQSFGGSLPDNQASGDGLGVLPLQHHTGTTDVNNELLVQKVFNKIVKTESDNTKTVNIRTSLTNGTVGTSADLSILSNTGIQLTYRSCKEILAAGASTGDGSYTIDPDGSGPIVAYPVYCDMTTDGGGWTLAVKATATTLNSTLRYHDTVWQTGVPFGDTTNLSNVKALGQAYSTVSFDSVMIRSLSTPSKRLAWKHPSSHSSIKDIIVAGTPVRDGSVIAGSYSSLDYRSGCDIGNQSSTMYYGFLVNDTSWISAIVGWGSNQYSSNFNTSGGFGIVTPYSEWDFSRHYHGWGNGCTYSEWVNSGISGYIGSQVFNGQGLFIR